MEYQKTPIEALTFYYITGITKHLSIAMGQLMYLWHLSYIQDNPGQVMSPDRAFTACIQIVWK